MNEIIIIKYNRHMVLHDTVWIRWELGIIGILLMYFQGYILIIVVGKLNKNMKKVE